MKKYQCIISEKLEELLESKGATMQRMSDETEIAYCRIVSWKFKNAPKVDWELLRAAEYFDVPLTYLLYGVWDLHYTPSKKALSLQNNYYV